MKTKIVLLFGLVFLVSGCAANKGVDYYWGNYSSTLYALKKTPGPEAEQRHVEELEEIIAVSAEKGYRVPPGVQAELGFRYAQQGNSQKAQSHFEAELASYPESQHFIEKMQRMIEE